MSEQIANVNGDHAELTGQALCALIAPSVQIVRRALVKHIDPNTVVCGRCRQLVTAPGDQPRTRPTLLEQIQADMLRRNPSLALEEWEVESYR